MNWICTSLLELEAVLVTAGLTIVVVFVVAGVEVSDTGTEIDDVVTGTADSPSIILVAFLTSWRAPSKLFAIIKVRAAFKDFFASADSKAVIVEEATGFRARAATRPSNWLIFSSNFCFNSSAPITEVVCETITSTALTPVSSTAFLALSKFDCTLSDEVRAARSSWVLYSSVLRSTILAKAATVSGEALAFKASRLSLTLLMLFLNSATAYCTYAFFPAALELSVIFETSSNRRSANSTCRAVLFS